MLVSNLGYDRFKQIELLVGGSRPRKLLSGNDVLSGGYSFKNFVHDAGKTATTINNAVPPAVKEQIKNAAIQAATQAVMSAAGRKAKKSPKKPKAPKHKLIKGSEEAKEFMKKLRAMRKKK